MSTENLSPLAQSLRKECLRLPESLVSHVTMHLVVKKEITVKNLTSEVEWGKRNAPVHVALAAARMNIPRRGKCPFCGGKWTLAHERSKTHWIVVMRQFLDRDKQDLFDAWCEITSSISGLKLQDCYRLAISLPRFEDEYGYSPAWTRVFRLHLPRVFLSGVRSWVPLSERKAKWTIATRRGGTIVDTHNVFTETATVAAYEQLQSEGGPHSYFSQLDLRNRKLRLQADIALARKFTKEDGSLDVEAMVAADPELVASMQASGMDPAADPSTATTYTGP